MSKNERGPAVTGPLPHNTTENLAKTDAVYALRVLVVAP